MHATFGWFEDVDDVNRALTTLREAGFSEENIGLVMPGRYLEDPKDSETGTSLGKRTGAGAAVGFSLGGLAGLLVGGLSIPIPGAGSLITAGVLVSVLGGAAAGATYGALAGVLLGLDDSGEEVDTFYSGLVDEGRILLVVEAKGNRALEARRIMRQASQKVSTLAEGSEPNPMVNDQGQRDVVGESDDSGSPPSKEEGRQGKALSGIFPDLRRADLAIRKLLLAGLSEDQIQIIDRVTLISELTPGLDLEAAEKIVAGDHLLDGRDNQPPTGPMEGQEKVAQLLIESGVDAAEAPYYADKLRRGSVLVIATPNEDMLDDQLEHHWNLLHPVYDPELPSSE